MSLSTRTIRVSLTAASYDVRVGAGIMASLGGVTRGLLPRARNALVVIDSNLPATTIRQARESLAAHEFRVHECMVAATEERKSLGSLDEILHAATRTRLERGEPIIALGGGIVSDLAGFAAAVYRRGVPVIQCPTTLLAMVDASVGGKTGVNLVSPSSNGAAASLKKNMIGAFHQPIAVVCDVATLDSLPAREFRSGLAECIKHALLAPDWDDAPLLEWMTANLPAIVGGDAAARIELVARNVAIKARVVANDEREERTDHRGRVVLNMGHTVGHAIEPLACRPVIADVAGTDIDRETDTEADPGTSPDTGLDAGLLHGEAVALGLIAETVTAEHLGRAAAGTSERVRVLLRAAHLPTRVAGLPSNAVILDAMRDDKKVQRGAVWLAVPSGVEASGAGSACVVFEAADAGALGAGIDAIRAG